MQITSSQIADKSPIVSEKESSLLNQIVKNDTLSNTKYSKIIAIEDELTRQVVSFQANKNMPSYRWYKYKEGFSASLVFKYINLRGTKNSKLILDPFAGSGTTLFAAKELGIDSVGIELLPIGYEIITVRNILINEFTDEDYSRLEYWVNEKPWLAATQSFEFAKLKITSGAYPATTEIEIQKYLATIQDENQRVKKVLFFALLCILESISFTRKDGQYLRWDQRSGRCIGAKPFDKGLIISFNVAIVDKIKQILKDTKYLNSGSLFDIVEKPFTTSKINLISGSCLVELPKMHSNTVDLIITSPPYCNRYDYTRTYALELAMIGINEQQLSDLRQTMLSCTVENRQKDLLNINPNWDKVLNIVDKNNLLQSLLNYLEFKKSNKTLNNNGLPRMIRGYFYEMACVIYELYRILNKNGQIIMVNDNVRYAGASVSVDLILSEIAEGIGFNIEKIAVLPQNKGNSSQQMGVHGRDALRKCVYVWRKD